MAAECFGTCRTRDAFGAAFAPDVAAAASGAGTAVALATLAGVAGNIGAGHLTNMIERAADRIRGRDAPDAETARDALAGELLVALEGNDTVAQELSVQLTGLLMSIDGIPDVLGAAGSELRDYLLSGCFGTASPASTWRRWPGWRR